MCQRIALAAIEMHQLKCIPLYYAAADAVCCATQHCCVYFICNCFRSSCATHDRSHTFWVHHRINTQPVCTITTCTRVQYCTAISTQLSDKRLPARSAVGPTGCSTNSGSTTDTNVFTNIYIYIHSIFRFLGWGTTTTRRNGGHCAQSALSVVFARVHRTQMSE